MDDLSVEEALLCCLSRQQADGGDAERLLATGAPIRWATFGELAYEHRMLPLVRDNVRRLLPAALQPPGRIVHRWDDQAGELQSTVRSLALHLREIVDRFEGASIAYVIWKGPAFAELVYRDPAWREYHDLDFLVGRDDVMRAHDLLAELGFEAEPHGAGLKVTRDQVQDRVNRQNHQFPYLHGRTGCCVELHTGVTNQSTIELADIEVQPARLYGGALVPRLLELHVIACLHAYQHIPYNVSLLRDGAGRLGHFADVRESYLKIQAADQVTDLLQAAKRLACVDVVTAMLRVAERLFGRFAQSWAPSGAGSTPIRALEWDSAHFSSSLAKRLFRPQQQYDHIEQLHHQAEASDTAFNRVPCSAIPDVWSIPGLMQVWTAATQHVSRTALDRTGYFWPSHTSARRDLNPPLDIPRFLVGWNQSHLVVLAEVTYEGIAQSPVAEFRGKGLYLMVRLVHQSRVSDWYVPCPGSPGVPVLAPTSKIPQLPQLQPVTGADSTVVRPRPLLIAVRMAWTELQIVPHTGLALRFDIGLVLDNHLSAFLIYSGCAFEYGFLFDLPPAHWAHGRLCLS